MEGNADTVDVKWVCAQLRLALSPVSVRELLTPGRADILRSVGLRCQRRMRPNKPLQLTNAPPII
jgi:hypothetical protein